MGRSKLHQQRNLYTNLVIGGLFAVACPVALGQKACEEPPDPYRPKPVEVAKPKPPPPAPPKVEEPPPPEPVAPVHHAGAHHSKKKKHHGDAAPGTAEADLKDFAKPGAIKPPPPPVPEDRGGGRYGGKRCSKGKPCGNTCIPVSHQCHK